MRPTNSDAQPNYNNRQTLDLSRSNRHPAGTASPRLSASRIATTTLNNTASRRPWVGDIACSPRPTPPSTLVISRIRHRSTATPKRGMVGQLLC